jgi:lycopene beta-cyclase
MMQHSFFRNKQILVADTSPKTLNDRTWCFWEQKQGMFEEIVHHKWQQLDFYSNHFSARFDILPYEYKMIRGIDFYNYVLEKAKRYSNIHFCYGNVESLQKENDKAIATIDNKKLSANYIFNSIIFDHSIPSNKIFLLQHFKGWLIEVPSNIFDERIATFMDFRVSQEHGTAFVYILPVAKDKAIVEFTLITEQLLQQHQYDESLKKYIYEFLNLKNYSITEQEFGAIPMTNSPFQKNEARIINIGTAGNQTKASSGFTFSFIQKHSDAIIEALVNNKSPQITSSLFKRRFNLYDSILLNILHKKKMNADEIFAHLFKKNPPQRVLKFLDNETNFFEELKIMKSVPTNIFFPVAIRELVK